MFRVHMLILLFSAMIAGPAYAQSHFLLKDRHQGDPLGMDLRLYEDTSAELSWEEVRARLDQFTPSQAIYPNWKITSSRTWAYVQIENAGTTARDIFLENH